MFLTNFVNIKEILLMPTSRHIIAALVCSLLVIAVSCKGKPVSHVPDNHGIELDPAASPQTQAARAVDTLEPAQVAETLVAWMAGASHNHYPFAGRFTRSVVARYSGSGRDAEASRFTEAIDSVTGTLPLPLRAHVLTVAASPRVLAARIASDPDSALLAGAVAEAYGDDSIAAKSFVKAIKSIRQ